MIVRLDAWMQGLPSLVKVGSLLLTGAVGFYAGVMRVSDLPHAVEQNSHVIAANSEGIVSNRMAITAMEETFDDKFSRIERMLCLILLEENPTVGEIAECVANAGG